MILSRHILLFHLHLIFCFITFRYQHLHYKNVRTVMLSVCLTPWELVTWQVYCTEMNVQIRQTDTIRRRESTPAEGLFLGPPLVKNTLYLLSTYRESKKWEISSRAKEVEENGMVPAMEINSYSFVTVWHITRKIDMRFDLKSQYLDFWSSFYPPVCIFCSSGFIVNLFKYTNCLWQRRRFPVISLFLGALQSTT